MPRSSVPSVPPEDSMRAACLADQSRVPGSYSPCNGMAVTVPSGTARVRWAGGEDTGGMSSGAAPRMYTDLASWWPLISPPEEYAEEAAEAARHLRAADIPVREVLELGSGGGNNAVHLQAWFTMTLVDLNPAMLEVSRALNPGCEHIAGDMRTVRLGR